MTNKTLFHQQNSLANQLESGRNATLGNAHLRKLEEKLLISMRLLNLLHSYSHITTHTRKESEFFREICRTIKEAGGYRFVWIGKAEQDSKKIITPVAYYGFENGFFKKVKLVWSDKTSLGKGPTSLAIREGKPVVGKRLATDFNIGKWKKHAIERGYYSAASFPLRLDKKVWGALTIYSSQENYFIRNRKEAKILKELSENISFNMSAFRMKKSCNKIETEKKEMEKKLLESYKHLGMINRQMSILLDLNKHGRDKSNGHVLRHIVTSAVNIFKAEMAALYKYDDNGEFFSLLSCIGSKEKTAIKKMRISDHPPLLVLIREQTRIQGIFPPAMQKKVKTKNKIKHYVILPLIIRRNTRGSLILGFSAKKIITPQELDFYEAFAILASFALQESGVLK